MRLRRSLHKSGHAPKRSGARFGHMRGLCSGIRGVHLNTCGYCSLIVAKNATVFTNVGMVREGIERSGVSCVWDLYLGLGVLYGVET